MYVVSLFPCWSETFIVREIIELRRRNIDIAIFSLKPPSENMVQSDAEELAKQVIYPKSFFYNLLSSFLQFLRHPITNTSLLFSIKMMLFKNPLSFIKSLITFWRTLAVIDDIKRLNIDHIHAHWATYPSTAALVISKNTGITFSFTSHAHDIFTESQLIEKKIKDSLFSITISDFNIKYLKSQLKFWVNNKFHIVHCGINLDEFVFQRDNRQDGLILAVGRFDEIKGFTYLIEACYQLKQSNIKYKCIIIGDGPLRSSFEKQLSQLNLTDVQLVGIMPKEKVIEYLNKCEIFVLPSIKTPDGNMDGIPVALMEAMAMGAPVISTNVSGIPELVIQNKTGLVSEEKNSESLAENIKKLLSNQSLQKHLTENALSLIEQEFNIKNEVAKLHSLFKTEKN